MDNSILVISYLTLRKALGALGFALPFILAIGGYVIFGIGLQESISDYYHTGMGDVFVGIIVALGIFLLAYTGHKNDAPVSDNAVGNIAGTGAVVLALFPTASSVNPMPAWVGVVHWMFSAVFFLSLAYFCLFLFTKTHPDRTPTSEKRTRNQIYRACGWVMVAALILIAIHALLPAGTKQALSLYKPVFWLEAIAVLAFGISWLIKGEAILKDSEEQPVLAEQAGA